MSSCPAKGIPEGTTEGTTESASHGGSHGTTGGAKGCPHGETSQRTTATAGTPLPMDQPEAREALRRAYEKTSRWGSEFPGFTADLLLNCEGNQYKGKVTIRSPKEVNVQVELSPDLSSLQDWAQGQIAMVAAHRSSRPFEEADGKYVLTLGEEDRHPFGRLVYIHGDGMGSHYRVKEDRIQQVTRVMGRMNFCINVEEALTTKDAKFLTTKYTVFYFSPEGLLTSAESTSDHPVEVKGIYLPGSRRIIGAEKGAVSVRTWELTHHQLL